MSDTAIVASTEAFWAFVFGVGGLIFGAGGLVLGVVNYLRERPNVKVSLHWDMEPIANTDFHSIKYYGVIRAANVGRRPVFISHAHIKIKGMTYVLLISESITGIRLDEGDAPKTYYIQQNQDLLKYSAHWNKTYAVVVDTANKEYKSKPSKNKPKWAQSDNKT